MCVAVQLRVARHTDRLDEVVRFYRDGLGLPEIGGFRGHDGYDGVFLAVPGTATHLELTTGGGHPAPQSDPEALMVLYLGDDAAVRRVAERLDAAPVSPANPYWAEHGLTFEDPDGFRIVLVPARWELPGGAVSIGWHAGPRAQLRGLFALAEDSPARLEASLDQGRVLTAMDGDAVVGFLQLVDTDTHYEVELKTMAVVESRQRQGVGRALVRRAVGECRHEDARTLVVGTAAADIGNLRFYQRLGFRMLSIERDAFTPAEGYAEGMAIDGISLRDRVWLTLEL
jgi:GNAT superfamily N-acetyltransferase